MSLCLEFFFFFKKKEYKYPEKVIHELQFGTEENRRQTVE